MYTYSIYNLAFKKGDKYYLYNSRSNFFAEITEYFYNNIINANWKNFPEDVITNLLSYEILISKDTEYEFYYSELFKFNTKNYNKKRLNLVIAPTTSCNFDCHYCFEPKLSPKTMTDDTIKHISQFILSHKDATELGLTWYGGEPLLAFDKIKQIYSLITIETMPPITHHSIITNGYYFNDEVIDFFSSRNLNKIQITLDGIKARHDSIRCVKTNHEPTFDHILNNLRKIAIGLPNTRVDIRVNINKSNYRDFAEIYNLIKDMFPDNKYIRTYPGIIREEDKNGKSLCVSSFKPSELIDLYKSLEKLGINTSVFPRRKPKGCMMHASSGYIIGPEGEIYKCWNDVSDASKVVGSIFTKDLSNRSLFLKYATQAIPFNSECKNCVVFPICDGGCGLYRYRNMFFNSNYELCSPYKNIENLKEALLSREIK